MDMLNSFPPEVWEYITTYMDCYTLVALAYTSKRAIPMLGRGGLTCLSISGLNREASENLPSPSFLKQMSSLRSLSWKNMGGVLLSLEVYKSLPPKLTSLELDVYVPANMKFHKYLPPNLTHLRLPFTFDAPYPQLPSLPPSLTSLILPTNAGSSLHEDEDTLEFPPQLLYLDLVSLPTSTTNIAKLPPNLTSLRTHVPPRISLNSSDTTEWLLLLPLTLTHLEVTQNLSFADLDRLPAKLQSLATNLDYKSLEWVSHLPKSLTRLKHVEGRGLSSVSVAEILFVLLRQPVEEHASALSQISNSESTYEVRGLGRWNIADIEAVIPQITTLAAGSIYHTTPESTPQPWLTSLTSLSVYTSLPENILKSLPDSITHLAIANDLDSSWRLPASLTSFKGSLVPTIKSHPGYLSYRAPCVRWPRNLKSFEAMTLVADVAEPNFPSSINHFKASTCSAYGSDFSAKLLSSLKSIDIPHFRHLSQEMVEQFPDDMHTLLVEYSPKLTSKVLKSLPPNLTKLSLAWDDDSLFTDDNLHLLPQTLTYLALGISKYITHEGAAKLPSALRTLEWNYAQKLTPSIARALPRSLTELHLNRVEVDSMSFGDLPRNLAMLKLAAASSLDSAYFSDLPPALTFLDISGIHKLPDYGLQQLVDLPLLKSLHLGHPFVTNMKQRIMLSRIANTSVPLKDISKLAGKCAIPKFDD